MDDDKQYTKSVRKSSIAPNDGSDPLTVIEFSLTNDVKRTLEVALEPFVSGKSKDKDALAKIIRDNFPQPVLDELKMLSQKNENSAVVYVVKNLPGFIEEHNPKLMNRSMSKDAAMELWQNTPNYAHVIAKGVALALELAPGAPLPLFRNPNDTKLFADKLHKHDEDVTMLSVSKADGSATRFTDFQTLVEDEHAKDIKVSVTKHTTPLDSTTTETSLDKVPETLGNWRQAKEADLAVSKETAEPTANTERYNKKLQQHSLDVQTKDGDLVLWSNHGRVWHQARQPEQRAIDPKVLSRLSFSIPTYIR